MTSLRNIAFAALAVAVVAPPAAAADSLVASQRELASLHQREAGVRQRIGQFQLDALVASLDGAGASRKPVAVAPGSGSHDLERLIAQLQ